MRTARRRWTKELPNEVDGIAIGASGPVLVHGYDPPAGGKWVDDVIPGKLGALALDSGETLWFSPCEVGYGRGFGAGFGGEGDVVVLGPSVQGHRAVRMSLETGELLDAREIDAFDEALVQDDFCHLVMARRIWALSTSDMTEAWSYARAGERYHMIARDGDHLFAVYTKKATGKQGVVVLDARTGKLKGDLVGPNQSLVHAIAAGSGSVTIVLTDIFEALPKTVLRDYLIDNPDADVTPGGRLSILSHASAADLGSAPLWFDNLEQDTDESPEVLISHDGGRLYIVQGASLEVRELASGATLGEVTVPGLDEHVSWRVSGGAGVLAEETRLSIFEIPD